MRYRTPGGSRRLTSSDINEISAAIAQVQFDGATFDPSVEPDPRYVLVQNDSGADALRFTPLSIDKLLWELDTDGTSELVFSAVETDPSKDVVILVEDIPKDQTGYAIAAGVALAIVQPVHTQDAHRPKERTS